MRERGYRGYLILRKRLFQRWLFWPMFAAIMGFVVGGSVVWSFYQPNQTAHVQQSDHSPSSHSDKDQIAKTLGERLSIIWDRTFEDAVAFYTLILGIFTAFLAVVSATQIIFLLRADETARISAKSAERAAITAERALTAVERAFVAVAESGVDTIKVRGQVVVFRIRLNIVNSGRTPARRYMCYYNLAALDGEPPEDFRFADRPRKSLPVQVLGPQSRTFLLIDFFIQDAIAGYEGQKKPLVYGWLEYDDIFPTSVRHRTEFCMSIEVFADPREVPKLEVISGNPAALILTMRPYGRYNAHDDDCLYRPGETPIAEEGELPPLTLPPNLPGVLYRP